MTDGKDVTLLDETQMRDVFAAHALIAIGLWMPPQTAIAVAAAELVESLSNPIILAARAELVMHRLTP